VVGKIEDVLSHVGVFGKDFCFQFFSIENVGRTELDPVFYQAAVGLQYFCTKIDIDEQHGHEQAYDEKSEDFEHCRLWFFSAKLRTSLIIAFGGLSLFFLIKNKHHAAL
jgi:hypothetical protein